MFISDLGWSVAFLKFKKDYQKVASLKVWVGVPKGQGNGNSQTPK